IMRMCPYDKLTGCQKKYGETNISGNAVYEELANMVQGIMLNIDNSFLEHCKNKVNEKVIEICGSGEDCDAFTDDKYIGTESLSSYVNKDGNHVIEGLISFGNVRISKPESTDDNIKFGMYEVNIQDYQDNLNSTDPIANRVVSALQSASNKINQKIALLTQDPDIQMCISGRDMRQITGKNEKSTARFPNLLDAPILALISAGLDQANKNYNKKYNELVGKAVEAYDDAVKSVLCASMASSGPECLKYSRGSGNAVCTEYGVNRVDNIFKNEADVGLMNTGTKDGQNSVYSLRYVIPGVKAADLAAAQQSGHGEFLQTDGNGHEIGSMVMTAVYSSANNTCTLTTVTNMCSEASKIYDTASSNCSSGGGLVDIGGNGCIQGGGISVLGGGGSRTTTKSTFKGTFCEKYAEPVTTTTAIKM
ncbi:MAG: hypothetical protein IKL14_00640, partial [Alphaproteobacteria bacterium]|nr:hypothetical protein [Alphaproteobacteria bacterium]